ncbi:MAG: hypothetical protein ACJASQ_001109 [Crocinitomicaceae bacterium]|jgi:hypothetical protein
MYNKLILSLVAVATISLTSLGQAPEGFKYQAVVRDAGNTILNSQAVGMRMTIKQTSISGTTVYQETFATTTNAYGLVNLEIGSGTVVSGTFVSIDWSTGPYFIETAIDVLGGTSYAVMGTSELMSVPYALYAKTAESVTLQKELIDNDGDTKIQVEETADEDNIRFDTGGNESMILAANGNIGMGTGTPLARLDVLYNMNNFPAIRAIGEFGPTNGYLGVQGTDNFDGITTADYLGAEIGVLGISTGSSSPDNYGLLGHSNGYGARLDRTNGTSTVSMVTLAGPNAEIDCYGSDESLNARITENGIGYGQLHLIDPNNTVRATLFSDVETGGMVTYGTSSTNFITAELSGFANSGFAGVQDAFSTTKAGMYVDPGGSGIIFGDVKSFRMDHPNDDTKEIWYASVEGPEAAAYTRGTGTVVNGVATILFPDHFATIVNENTMTVTLTPGSRASMGLAVFNKSATGFEVGELMNGTGTYTFDWVAMGVRKGYEDFEVVREKINLTKGRNKQAKDIIIDEIVIDEEPSIEN